MFAVRHLASKLAMSLLAIMLMAGAPALAQTSSPKPSGWEFDASPYIWGAGLDGDVKVGRLPSTGVEATFSDLVTVLDLGLMGSFEGRKGHWGFLVDAVYVSLSDSQPTPNSLFGDAEVDLVQELYTFAGSYRVIDGKTSLDVIVGARYTNLSTDLELTGGIASGRTADSTESWWDGFAGARVQCRPGEHWVLMGHLDLGAGGSELTWQALAGAAYSFNKTIALKFGYRYISVDYEEDEFLYDMAMAGPYVGVGFKF